MQTGQAGDIRLNRSSRPNRVDSLKGIPMYRRMINMAFLLLVFWGGSVTVVWAKKPINTNWRGLAVKGYDVVAYHVLAKPVKGSKEFEAEWQGVKWRFSSADHLKRFQSDPQKYAPQYGGY